MQHIIILVNYISKLFSTVHIITILHEIHTSLNKTLPQ